MRKSIRKSSISNFKSRSGSGNVIKSHAMPQINTKTKSSYDIGESFKKAKKNKEPIKPLKDKKSLSTLCSPFEQGSVFQNKKINSATTQTRRMSKKKSCPPIPI